MVDSRKKKLWYLNSNDAIVVNDQYRVTVA